MRRHAEIHPVGFKKVKMPTSRVLILETIYVESRFHPSARMPVSSFGNVLRLEKFT
jgi:hypothetical protein